MYAQNDIITNCHVIRHTEEKISEISSPEKIIFWTCWQQKIMSDATATRVAFISDYGTGKTILLMHKAQHLIKENQNILVVIISDLEITELKQKYEKSLKQDDQSSKYCEVLTGTILFSNHLYNFSIVSCNTHVLVTKI
jgi:superfamily II DNA or RNA helicase